MDQDPKKNWGRFALASAQLLKQLPTGKADVELATKRLRLLQALLFSESMSQMPPTKGDTFVISSVRPRT
jgi:hypothetical protein